MRIPLTSRIGTKIHDTKVRSCNGRGGRAGIEQRLAADRPVSARAVQGRKGAPREARVTALAALARPAPSLGLQLKADVLPPVETR